MTAESQRTEADEARARVNDLKHDAGARKASAREHIEQTRRLVARGVNLDAAAEVLGGALHTRPSTSPPTTRW
ncbi:MAG: hypothetical protein ABR604_06000 [Jatrophihabitantaceae bacterium]